MIATTLPWHPHTEDPRTPTTAIIAANLGDATEPLYCLVGPVYLWRGGQWLEEGTGDILDTDTPFFWLAEADLMATITPQTH